MFSKMAMQHKRQAPGRDIHRHFSLAPARSHTITASSKASATATRNPPPHPVATTGSEQTQTVKGRCRGGQWYAVHALTHAAALPRPPVHRRRRPVHQSMRSMSAVQATSSWPPETWRGRTPAYGAPISALRGPYAPASLPLTSAACSVTRRARQGCHPPPAVRFNYHVAGSGA